tara:strand:- start:670 stop:1848 length:1179 start_codon:yes stop_codon:yes gene_type:complete
MSMQQMLLGGGSGALKIEDVWGIEYYTGNGGPAVGGSNIVINNGLDLAGHGGLIITKSYDNVGNWNWADSEVKQYTGYPNQPGIGSLGQSNSTAYHENVHAVSGAPTYGYQSFNNNGFTIGNNWLGENNSGHAFTSYAFRKAEKFFDVVTYTGTGSNPQSVSHNLGVTPGMVIYKSYGPASGNTSGWLVWHCDAYQGTAAGGNQSILTFGRLDSSSTFWSEFPNSGGWHTPFDATNPDASNLYLGYDGSGYITDPSMINVLNEEYVAYVFGGGHDDDTGIIKCGWYQATGSSGLSITGLGFKPGFLMIKDLDQGTGGWFAYDEGRSVNGLSGGPLAMNTNAAQLTSGSSGGAADYGITFDSDGFTINNIHPGMNGSNTAYNKHIYIALKTLT